MCIIQINLLPSLNLQGISYIKNKALNHDNSFIINNPHTKICVTINISNSRQMCKICKDERLSQICLHVYMALHFVWMPTYNSFRTLVCVYQCRRVTILHNEKKIWKGMYTKHFFISLVQSRSNTKHCSIHHWNTSTFNSATLH